MIPQQFYNPGFVPMTYQTQVGFNQNPANQHQGNQSNGLSRSQKRTRNFNKNNNNNNKQQNNQNNAKNGNNKNQINNKRVKNSNNSSGNVELDAGSIKKIANAIQSSSKQAEKPNLPKTNVLLGNFHGFLDTVEKQKDFNAVYKRQITNKLRYFSSDSIELPLHSVNDFIVQNWLTINCVYICNFKIEKYNCNVHICDIQILICKVRFSF